MRRRIRINERGSAELMMTGAVMALVVAVTAPLAMSLSNSVAGKMDTEHEMFETRVLDYTPSDEQNEEEEEEVSSTGGVGSSSGSTSSGEESVTPLGSSGGDSSTSSGGGSGGGCEGSSDSGGAQDADPDSDGGGVASPSCFIENGGGLEMGGGL